MALVDSYGGGKAGGGFQPQSKSRGLVDSYTPADNLAATRANQQHMQDQKTLNSFLSLDPTTRSQTLSRLTTMAAQGNKDASSKIQLLTPHVRAPYNQAQDNFAPAPTFKNKILNAASNFATEQVGNPIVRGAATLGQTEKNYGQGKPLLQGVNKKQFLADAVQTGTNFAGGVGSLAEKGGKFGAEELGKVGAKEVAKTVGKSAASAGLLNAAVSGTNTYGQGGTTKQVLASAAKGGILGVTIGAAGGGLAASTAARQATKIATLKQQLSQSTVGGKLGQLKNLLDDYQARTDAATIKSLPEGATSRPAQISAGANGLRDATRTPGGGVLVNAEESKVAPVASSEAPKAKTDLNTNVQQWNKDRLSTGTNARGTIARVNTLNNIIEHPDASPEIKASATQARHNLIHDDAKDAIAQAHSAQTGQPVSVAHETLKGGQGDHAPLYQAVDDHQRTRPPAAIAQDYTPEKETPQPTEGSPASLGTQKTVSETSKAFRSGEGLLRTMGSAGNDLADRMDKHTFDTNALVNKYSKQLPTLNKLKGEDASNLYDVVENKATPRNANVAQAAQEWGTVRKQIISDAHANGRDVSDYGNTYLPHDFSEHFKNTTSRSVAARKLVASGEAKDLGEASRMLQTMEQYSKTGNKFGSFDKERLTNSLTYKKSLEPIHNYIEGASKAIAADKHFGVDQKDAEKLIDRIGTDGHDFENAKRTFDYHVGNKQMNSNKFAQALRTGQAVTKLGRAAISNATQINNTQTMAGVANTAKAVFETFRGSAADKEFIEKSGVAGHALEEIRQQQGGLKGKATSALMPFFNKVETFNRSSGALAGRSMADNLAKKAAAGNAKAEAYLRDTLKVEGPIGTKLTEEQQIAAARQVVKHTQFLVGSKDLPHWMANTQSGRTLTQFKSFSYKQQQFLADQILRPAAKGDFAPLARYVAGTAVLGGGAYTLRNLVNGTNTSKSSTTSKVVNAAQAAGGFGVFGDTIQNLFDSAGYDHPGSGEKTAEAVAGLFGPALGTAVEAGTNIKKAVDGSTYGKLNLEKYATGQIPVIGPRLAKSGLFDKNNVSINQNTFSAMNGADKINYLNSTSDKNRNKLLNQTDKNGVTVRDKTLQSLLTDKKTVQGLLQPTDKQVKAGIKPLTVDDLKQAVAKLGVPKDQQTGVIQKLKYGTAKRAQETRAKNATQGPWVNPLTSDN